MQEIKKGWKKVKLGEISEFCSRGISPKYSDFGISVINQKCIRDNKIDFSLSRFHNIDKKFSEDKLIKKYDILINSTGVGTLGRVSQVKENINYFTVDSHVTILRLDSSISKEFVGYVLINLQEIIEGLGKGATGQIELSRDDVKKIEILLPPLPTQQKIASILSKYDDLIENNNKRIKILEETAQSIYEEWFVKYNFPGNENIKMIDSGNDDFGMIPEGWEVKKVEEYVDFIRGVEPGSKNYKEIKGEDDIVFIRVGDLGNRNSGIYIDNDLSKGKIVNEKDVLVTFDGTVGIVKRGFYGCYSTGIRKLSGKKDFISNYFLYLLFKSEQIQNKIKEHAKGTTILHAGESIKYMEFVLATEDMYKKFNDIVGKVLDEILNIEKQNQNLKETRDLLIPRLVSGELDVESLDVK